MIYLTRSHISGDVIDEFATIGEAIKACDNYAQEDEDNNEYEPDCYEVYNSETEKVEYTA